MKIIPKLACVLLILILLIIIIIYFNTRAISPNLINMLEISYEVIRGYGMAYDSCGCVSIRQTELLHVAIRMAT